MATDPLFLRLVGGNVDNPRPSNALSAHDFIAALQMWANGEITKQNVVDAYDFTEATDSATLDSLKQWFNVAKAVGLEPKFTDIVEWRLILGRDKRTASGAIDLNGKFGYATQSIFIGGADGAHSLKDTGPMAARFTTWAA